MCRQQVADLAEHHQAILETGAFLVIVGNGGPEHIPELRIDTGYTGEVVCDPSLKSYQALDFSRNITGVFSPKTLIGGLKAFSSGHRQRGIQGDTMQLGGAVVIGPGSDIHYYYKGQQAADHPPVKDIIKACMQGTTI